MGWVHTFSGGGGIDRDPARKYHQTQLGAIHDVVPLALSAHAPHERVIARAANLIVGRQAHEAACRQYPKARLTLRQGIRVIEETER